MDGRHERRRRNREAVIDALVALLDEGEVYPTAAMVAQRAGLSPRSLFRYFDDTSDLVREAITRLANRVVPTLRGLVVDPSNPLTYRIAEVARVLDAVYPLARAAAIAARVRAPQNPEIAERLVATRTLTRDLMAQTFAPELQARSPKARRALLAGLDLWCTFEVQHVLRSQGPVEGVDPVKLTIQGLTALFQDKS